MKEEIKVNEIVEDVDGDGWDEAPMPEVDDRPVLYTKVTYQKKAGGRLKHEKPIRNVYFKGDVPGKALVFVQNTILGGVPKDGTEPRRGKILGAAKIYTEIMA